MFKEWIIDITPNPKGEIGFFFSEITDILEELFWLSEKQQLSCNNLGTW